LKQSQFETEQADLWGEYRKLLQALEGPGPKRSHSLPLERFPRLFRRLCGHYALARSRGYSPGLVAELHELVRRGYRQLHRHRLDWLGGTLSFLSRGFPRTLRRHAWAFWLAAALFFGPMLAMGLASYGNSAAIYSLLDPARVAQMESMYDPTNRKPGRTAERQADTDFAMFGFYVMNNVSIAFRTFAGGIFLGLGSLFFLGFNGLVIGAVGGHLTQLGFGETFWPFVSGHAALELTAIAISGAAGLLLAAALIAPGRRRRLEALRGNAREAVKLVAGAMVMLVLAAAVEGFWSGSGSADPIKYLVGIFWWLLVVLYLALAGRGGEDGV
jgi:uncharacterized membrane protein SpoIIM required for sporulation